MHAKNDALIAFIACLKYEIKVLNFKASSPCKSCDALCAENEKLKDEVNWRKMHVEAFRRACNNLDFENHELRSSLANLQSEIDLLKSNASCRMDLPGPTTSVGTRTDYSVGPWDYSACATRHLKAWSTRTTQE
jgi:FtsZ-binding cell division protein ZapB